MPMINLPPTAELPPSPQAAARGKFFLYGLLLLVLGLVVWFLHVPRVQATLVEWNQHSLWENVKRLTGAEDISIAGEQDNRINVLLLGQGGAKHDGPYLTDTIILASIQLHPLQVALLSLPRDLVVPIPGFGLRKVNSANAYGESLKAGQGAAFAGGVVASVLNVPVPYYVRLDFLGFAKIVDKLGGLPITVQQGFSDNQYPTDDNGYATVSFKPGWQLMSGEQALEFVRSRHGSGGEGSDFARARRQQQVLVALKEKILSPATLFNPLLALKLYGLLSQSLQTNLSPGQVVRLAHLVGDARGSTIATRVFDANPGGLLRETIGEDGAYLLEPIVPDYSELKQVAASIFAESILREENAQVVVENGTSTQGIAETLATSLKNQGFAVSRFGNAGARDLSHTVLYDYTGGEKPATRQALEAMFATVAVPLERPGNEAVDFRLVIGADYRLAP